MIQHSVDGILCEDKNKNLVQKVIIKIMRTSKVKLMEKICMR